MFELLTFPIDEIDNAFWKKYYNFNNKNKNLDDTEEHFIAWKNNQTIPIPLFENHLVSFLMQENEVLAVSHLETCNNENLVFNIRTDLKVCTPEIAALFVKLFIQNRAKYDYLQNMAKTAFAIQLFQIIQAKVAFELDYYSLDLKKVNMQKLEQKIANIEIVNSDCHLKFFDMVPDEYLSEYCEVYSEILKNISDDYSDGESTTLKPEIFKESYPRKREREISVYNYLVFNSDNKMIGFTVVQVFRNNLLGIPPYQLQTGVLKAYRNRKIASWLKMAMMKKLVIDFPQAQEMRTDTSPTNHGMKKINKQLGYEYIYTGKAYKLDLKTLESLVIDECDQRECKIILL